MEERCGKRHSIDVDTAPTERFPALLCPGTAEEVTTMPAQEHFAPSYCDVLTNSMHTNAYKIVASRHIKTLLGEGTDYRHRYRDFSHAMY